MTKYKFAAYLKLAILLGPSVAFAQNPPGGFKPQRVVETVEALVNDSILCPILNWVYYLAIVGSVLFILISAFNFMSSGGNPEKVAEARKSVIWAMVGIVVAILAKSMPYIIANFFANAGAVEDFCT